MTVENPKLIITGGCSYTTSIPNSRNINWPLHIHDRVKTNLINTAMGGSGNISISRRIVFQVTNALKIFKPEELLVGIMWSAPHRRDLPKEKVDDYNGPSSQRDYATINFDKREYIKPNESWHHPLSSTNCMEYHTMHYSQPSKTSVLWYKHFQHDIDDMINTLETILHLQLFLKSRNINYFMTTYMNHVLDNAVMKSDNFDCQLLNELIDYSVFLDIDGAHEWILQDSIYKKLPFSNEHPISEQMKDLTDKIILPHLEAKGYIESC